MGEMRGVFVVKSRIRKVEKRICRRLKYHPDLSEYLNATGLSIDDVCIIDSHS